MNEVPSLQRSEPKPFPASAVFRGALARVSILAALAIAAVSAPRLIAQEDSEEEIDLFEPGASLLPRVVVTADKYPRPRAATGSSVTVFEADALEQSQIRSLENALLLVPGAVTASSGARGSITSVFLRGTESDQTQIVVDGIRVSDSNILPNPFLGGENLHNLGSIEILRGPQSALYGGEAIGGVISLFTRRGEGEPSLTLFGEAGSFGTFLGGVSGEGELDALAYSFSAGSESTQNDRPNNDFEQYQSSLRLDFQPGETTTLGFTLRQAFREFGSPGDVTMNDPDNLERDSTILLSSHLEHHVTQGWITRLTLGTVLQEFQSETPPAVTDIDSSRIVADWRHIFEFSEKHTTLIGAGLEQTSIENSGFGDIDETESIVSAYGQHTVQLTESFALTGGIRYEEYESFGHVWTQRATATYAIQKTGTRFHGSYGSGFRSPSFLDLYGTSAFFVGNPALVPEESRGWDAGVEQRLGRSALLDVTWFRNDIENLIDFDFSVFPGTVVNIDEATTEGLEVALRGTFGEGGSYSLAYTLLEALDESDGSRLLRRPRHTLGFDINARLGERLLLGAGCQLVDDRTDFGVRTFTAIRGDDYFLARFYAGFDIADNVSFNLRIENAFDQSYDEVDGFPGLGLGVYAGMQIDF